MSALALEGSALTKIGIGGVSMDKLLKVLLQSFYVMGKALSGELCCMRTGLVTKGGFLFASLDDNALTKWLHSTVIILNIGTDRS